MLFSLCLFSFELTELLRLMGGWFSSNLKFFQPLPLQIPFLDSSHMNFKFLDTFQNINKVLFLFFSLLFFLCFILDSFYCYVFIFTIFLKYYSSHPIGFNFRCYVFTTRSSICFCFLSYISLLIIFRLSFQYLNL